MPETSDVISSEDRVCSNRFLQLATSNRPLTSVQNMSVNVLIDDIMDDLVDVYIEA